ncbi:MAG: type II toxin-antitoxin system RelE/ParE family toxin [Candidatus Atribacteria bacterium]|nr:type II toxin-antitoxin system RelE/ParE family toxin [Candidatus Atribacteria bacterium]
MESLVEQPRPPGARQLKGSFEWRIRVGHYRVIYEIHDDRLFVLVVKAGHRREICRKTYLPFRTPPVPAVSDVPLSWIRTPLSPPPLRRQERFHGSP